MARATVTITATTVTVVMPIEERVSKSGKMLLIATTGGNQETETQYKGKPIYANVNLGIYATDKE